MNKKLKRPPLNELLEVAGVDTKNKKIIIEYENNVNVEDIPNILEKYLKEKKKHINSKLIGVRTDKYDISIRINRNYDKVVIGGKENE